MAQTITDSFIDLMWEFSRRDFPPEIVDECRVCLLDYIACASLGEKMLRAEYKSYLNAFGCNNGVNAHYSELDDGHRFAMLHPGVPVISALLSVAQDKLCSAEAFFAGMISGYEATIRLSGAIQPGHKKKGYHATGTCGTIGAAIGVMVMLDYPKKLWNTVISAATTSAAGLLQVIDDGSELKPFNAGRASASAVESAYFGKTGMTGPDDVLGGSRGFFNTVTDRVDKEYLLGDDGKYAIKSIYRKPYAACRHCHAPIEATLNLCKEHRMQAKDIQHISVNTYGLAVKGHEHTEIKGASSAKMSIPYAVAAAARYGDVNFQQYSEECMGDKVLEDLIHKVSVVEDDELSKLVPGRRPAVVTIETDTGNYTKRVDYPLGEPENPMSYETIKMKFFSMMNAAGKELDDSREVLDCIEHMKKDLNPLLERM